MEQSWKLRYAYGLTAFLFAAFLFLATFIHSSDKIIRADFESSLDIALFVLTIGTSVSLLIGEIRWSFFTAVSLASAALVSLLSADASQAVIAYWILLAIGGLIAFFTAGRLEDGRISALKVFGFVVGLFMTNCAIGLLIFKMLFKA